MASSQQIEAPYGTWESPITTEVVTGKTINLDAVRTNKFTGSVYWLERRPDGRFYIVERDRKGNVRDVLPSQYSARSSVHEYGGASFALNSIGDIIFVDAEKDAVGLLKPSTGALDVVRQQKGLRYADFDGHPIVPDKVIAVEEDHTVSSKVTNRLVSFDTNTKNFNTIQEGADFYITPRFSPNGHNICWLQWDLPDMPWTGAKLYIADYVDGSITKIRRIAGDNTHKAISQPRWTQDGSLFFTSDRNGFWQFFRFRLDVAEPESIVIPQLEHVNFSNCEWRLGTCTYLPLTAEKLVAVSTKDAQNALVVIDTERRSFVDLGLPLTSITPPLEAMAPLSESEFVVIGRQASKPIALYQINLISPNLDNVIKFSSETSALQPFFSAPQHISFPRPSSSSVRGHTYGFFFPPHNPSFTAPKGTLPPLIIEGHGGPTSMCTSGLTLNTQYDTSRGYAVLLLNYGGSSGYTRAYREELNSRWGVLDAADAVTAAEWLGSNGYIDLTRVGIRGGSAGGYLVLQDLVAYPKTWAGGVSYYGIGDMAGLIATTHKFESRYLDALIYDEGMSEAEKEKRVKDRSPVLRASNIRAPVLLLQGDVDKVVPMDQAEGMAKTIKEQGGECKLVIFEGEGHGFRRSDSLKTAREEEEKWWRKTLVRDQ
ncbi:MAG: hypothetical protein M1820_001052 [Bogoriella megaspora]|nr:MAG: hypothetical protein M1820_001052 [Bogoriella megaspora]